MNPRSRPRLRAALRAVTMAAALAASLGTTLFGPSVAGADPRAAGPDAYTVRGFDTYHGDHGERETRPFDWPAVARGGQSFVFLKATQGTDFTDPWFARDLAGARSVDLIRSGYHFFTADKGGAAQADHFVNVLRREGFTGTHPGELPPVLDLEQCERGGHRLKLAEVKAFLDRVERATGSAPLVYTRRTFVDECLGGTEALSGYRVWLARYGDTPPRPLPGGRGWDFWQYSDHRPVPGVGTKVDANVFHGDRAALRRLAHLG
ncbi:glycoside hydrolase family 25 protein [Kitasatospora sp. NPDC004240]